VLEIGVGHGYQGALDFVLEFFRLQNVLSFSALVFRALPGVKHKPFDRPRKPKTESERAATGAEPLTFVRGVGLEVASGLKPLNAGCPLGLCRTSANDDEMNLCVRD
jgi:hypothetical protein